jgi:sugar O-acyltransferase (sialic acid O-acetyltransferase NeuD family)
VALSRLCGQRAAIDVKDVVIFGTGPLAQRLFVYLTTDAGRDVAAFTVDGEYLSERKMLGIPVVPFEELERTHPPDSHAICVTVGYRELNQARARVCERCTERGYELTSYTSSRACRWPESTVGTRNTYLLDSTSVQPFATVGDDVFLMGCYVSHHSTVRDHCYVASGAVIAGNVTVGPNCFIGVNATIRDGVTIAPRCVIGAGALIKEDTVEGEVYSARATEPLPVKSWDLREL